MSITAPRKRPELPEELMTRLRRQLLVIITVLLAVGAGWLGIIMRPYLGQILLTVVAIGVVSLAVVSAVDFFRDR